MKDVFAGRFVKYEEKRKNTAGNLIGDYRYMIDFSAHFFYLVSPFVGAHNYTPTVTTLPNTVTARGTEPQATFTPQLQPAMTSLAGSLNAPVANATNTSVTSTSGHAENKEHPNAGTVPTNAGYAGNWGTYSSEFTWGSADTKSINTASTATYTSVTMYWKNSASLIEQHSFSGGHGGPWGNPPYGHTITYAIGEVDCLENDIQHIINGDEGGASNDYSYVKGKINTLDGLVSYRDPLLEVDGGGEYDAAKKTAAETFDTAISDCKSEFDDLDNYHDTDYDGQTYSLTDATALADELDACYADIGTRLTELNARIGNPTYSGGQSSNGTEPGIRVSALPAKASGTLVPYGRTIYEAVNVALGDDIGLINEVVAEADSLQFKYKEVRDKRNEYDMLKGRSKYYGN